MNSNGYRKEDRRLFSYNMQYLLYIILHLPFMSVKIFLSEPV